MQTRIPHWLSKVVLLAALFPALGSSAEEISNPSVHGPAAEPAQPSLVGFLGLAEGLSATPLLRVEGAETGARDELAAMAAWNARGAGPIQNGISRRLPEELVGAFRRLGSNEGPELRGSSWLARSQGGMVAWSSSVSIENAHRLRLELTNVRVPPGSRAWVWGAGGSSAPIAVSFDYVDEDRTLWTPSVEGDSIFVEIQVPEESLRGEDPEALLRIRRVLQIFDAAPQAGECLVDATCVGAGTFGPIADVRKAVAHMQYIKNGNSYVCSGGLLNDTVPGTFVPYFLTANHCLSTSAAASSLEAFFDFRSATCSGSWPNLSTLPRTNGSNLIATNVQSDFTLLRLSSLPANRVLLGWTTGAVPDNGTLHRVSHPFPAGYPSATVQAYSRTTNETNPDLTCPTDSDGRPWGNLSKFHYSEMSAGGTYGGSSGSPVYDSNGYVVGQLLGACGTNNEGCSPDHYTVDGRFSATYPFIDEFIDPPVSGGPCVPGPTTLCIDNNPGDKRFKVEITYQSVLNGGVSGAGKAVPLASIGVAKGGLFWFFTADNPEVLIKIINGCGSNGKFWIFSSAGTTLGMIMTITDTVGTSPPVVITNPDLTPAAPIATINGFTC